MAKENSSLQELYVDELRDFYNAEQHLIKALPKMAKVAQAEELRNGFQEHLEQTKGHAKRSEQIFQALGESPKGKTCAGMEGIVAEGGQVMDDDYEGAAMDAALITAAQRVEHYEIAAYGSVRAFATLMGESQAAELLEQTLDEERETDQKLTELSADINRQAYEGRSQSTQEKQQERPRLKTRSARAGSSR